MALTNVIITGDTHGRVAERLGNIRRNLSTLIPEETAVIICGDAGLNYWLNNSDRKAKRQAAEFGYRIYCVRGNHEERPENLGYRVIYDEDVKGEVYQDSHFPNIRYFLDGGEYEICGRRCLTIGGAYSVDKWYRLRRAELSGESFCGWFKDEQLTAQEMEAIAAKVAGKEYDFVFSHTCPYSWQPVDMFMATVNQSTVDSSMEKWMDELKDNISYGVWCFGHYHADRIERPFVEQCYMDYETMDTIENRWSKYRETGSLDWWLPVSPVMERLENA